MINRINNILNKLYGKTARRIYAAGFSVIEATLILLILFSAMDKIVLCYASVAVAFLLALPFLFENAKINSFIIAALFFTLVADFFLVIEYGRTGEYIYQCHGVSAFMIVQILYFLYIYRVKGKGNFLPHLLVRLALSFAVITVSFVVIGESNNYLSVISAAYFSWLIMNIVLSSVNFKNNWLLFVGLIFFALCDLYVGLQGADGVFFDIPSGFLHDLIFPSFNAIWLFYGVSQTLIVLHLVLKPKRLTA